MDVVIYHNPDCGTSRSTLKLLHACGFAPTVIEYLKTPPDEGELLALLHDMRVSLQEILREKGTPFNALGLGAPGKGEDELLAAVRQHPVLINRPIVQTPKGVRLCRPSDVVLDLLPELPRVNVTRDDGTPFLRDYQLTRLADLALVLEGAGLQTADLGEPGRTFFQYTRLDGEGVGWGGFELYGADVLLRSMAVEGRFHRQGNGRNLAALLMRRAYERGARHAYTLTDSADALAFFERIGFRAVDRLSAPPFIQFTRQARELCPASATLLARRITL